jgi:hypothetical protein
MKILAYTLLALGLIMMALGRPFTDHQNLPVLFIGGVTGLLGVFLRSRLRRGIPILAITDQDRAQFKLRPDFLRDLFGHILGYFGAFFLLVGISAPFYSEADRYDWRGSAVAIVLGLVLLLYAKPLLRKSR